MSLGLPDIGGAISQHWAQRRSEPRRAIFEGEDLRSARQFAMHDAAVVFALYLAYYASRGTLQLHNLSRAKPLSVRDEYSA